jgi:uncharacterized protein (DUF952 family)
MDGRIFNRVSFMVYHVTPAHEWNEQHNADYFAPASFEDEGFIHCCTHAQLAGVLERYYKGQIDLLLLTIDDRVLAFPVTYEKATNDELFPHIYGAINKNAITTVEKIA